MADAAEGRFPCRRAFLGQPAPCRWARDVSTLGNTSGLCCVEKWILTAVSQFWRFGGKGAEGGQVASQLLSLEAYHPPTDKQSWPT